MTPTIATAPPSTYRKYTSEKTKKHRDKSRRKRTKLSKINRTLPIFFSLRREKRTPTALNNIFFAAAWCSGSTMFSLRFRGWRHVKDRFPRPWTKMTQKRLGNKSSSVQAYLFIVQKQQIIARSSSLLPGFLAQSITDSHHLHWLLQRNEKFGQELPLKLWSGSCVWRNKILSIACLFKHQKSLEWILESRSIAAMLSDWSKNDITHSRPHQRSSKCEWKQEMLVPPNTTLKSRVTPITDH